MDTPMQGMMQSAPDSQVASQLMGQAEQPAGTRFNGVVQSDEGQIVVRNGIAQVGGDVYFVSDDGMLVGDKNGGLVAVIIDGKVIEPTKEIIDQLRQMGKVE
jgi:hypothetical protein